MQAMRKFTGVSRAVLGAASAAKKAPFVPMMSRFSTILKRDNESHYILQQEEQRKQALRANLEKIMGMNDEDPEKQEIIEKLCESPPHHTV